MILFHFIWIYVRCCRGVFAYNRETIFQRRALPHFQSGKRKQNKINSIGIV